jgi:hypothetical protein
MKSNSLWPKGTVPPGGSIAAHLSGCKCLDQVVNVADACRLLDLGKRLTKQAHLLVAHILQQETAAT